MSDERPKRPTTAFCQFQRDYARFSPKFQSAAERTRYFSSQWAQLDPGIKQQYYATHQQEF